jgi:2-polyprenyl-3-methyl-5-hydroxy-6-metoxy-1,4-benzoquinol methylase
MEPSVTPGDRQFSELISSYEATPVVAAPPGLSNDARMERARAEAPRIDRMVGLRGQQVLEIGCGEGHLSYEIASNYDATVTGVDVRDIAGWKALNHPNLALMRQDLTAGNPPWPANTFTRIISRAVWEHIRHPFTALKRAQELLHPSGKMYLFANLYRSAIASHLYREIPFPWPHLLFSPEVLAARVGRKSISQVNKLTYAHYLLYFKKLGMHITYERLHTRPIDRAFYEQHEQCLGLYPEFDLGLDFLEVVLEFDPDHPKEPIPDPVYRLK